MARLTRLQLRAIFAKMRGISRMPSAGRGRSGIEINAAKRALRSVWNRKKIDQLIARLPRHHQAMSEMQDLKLLDRSIPGVGDALGLFDRRGDFGPAGALYLVRSRPRDFLVPIGYSSRPSHRPGGAYYGDRWSDWLSPAPATRAGRERSARRNIRLGGARAFYHEYGHSVSHVAVDRWRSASGARGEWTEQSWRHGPYEPPVSVSANESFAEAYAFYATSRPMRMRLKRERPHSYEFMKEFFGA